MKIKLFIITGLAIFVMIVLQGCILDGNQVIKGTGTIKYQELEGGFFGIITDKDQHLDPRNLPKEFMIDGLRVRFVASKAEDIASIHMWGTIVDIMQIEKE